MSDTIISSVILCPNPMCKYTNPLKSKFCMQCGSPLADAANDGKKVKIVVLENQKVLQEFSLADKSIVETLPLKVLTLVKIFANSKWMGKKYS